MKVKVRETGGKERRERERVKKNLKRIMKVKVTEIKEEKKSGMEKESKEIKTKKK